MKLHADEAARGGDEMAEGLLALEVLVPLAGGWKRILLSSLVTGALALGVTYLIPPTYTARTTLLPPTQQQNSAAAALSTLGNLGGLAGLATAQRNPADQFVSLIVSETVLTRMVERFKLVSLYGVELPTDARRELLERVRVSLGKKDGLITVEVDDHDPKRAAEMAAAFLDELRQLTSRLALTESQQRRQFFEGHLATARDALSKAQHALQSSGFDPGALRAEPRVAAEGYARLKAETTAAEARLQVLRQTRADAAAEVQQQLSLVDSLRHQLDSMERQQRGGNAEYLSRYREFKYQETLFDLFARQYELARVDESREGTLIQVVDPATPPERRSRPKRVTTAVVSALVAGVVVALMLIGAHAFRRAAQSPRSGEVIARIRAAARG